MGARKTFAINHIGLGRHRPETAGCRPYISTTYVQFCKFCMQNNRHICMSAIERLPKGFLLTI